MDRVSFRRLLIKRGDWYSANHPPIDIMDIAYWKLNAEFDEGHVWFSYITAYWMNTYELKKVQQELIKQLNNDI